MTLSPIPFNNCVIDTSDIQWQVVEAKQQAQAALKTAKDELRRVLEEQKLSRVVEITSALRKEKQQAEEAAKAQAEAISDKKIAALVQALKEDKVKAVRDIKV